MTDVVVAAEEIPVGGGEGVMHGFMMPERVLQEIIREGFAKIKADTSIIDELFYKLTDDEIVDIKGYFSSHTTTVRLNFPRDGIKFPIISIITGADSEDIGLDVLGDYLGQEESSYGDYVSAQGHADRSDYQIVCMAGKDSNAVLWLYYLCKAVLAANLDILLKQGLYNMTVSGRDMTIREDIMPEFTYARTLTLTCNNYFAVRLTERVATTLRSSLFVQVSTQEQVEVTYEELP